MRDRYECVDCGEGFKLGRVEACEGFVVRVGPGGRPNPRIPSFRQSFRSAYGSHGSIYVQCRRDRGRRRRIRACRLRIASCSIIMLSYRRTHLLRDRAGMDWMTETAMKCNVWGAGGCGAWFCRRWGCDLFSRTRPTSDAGPIGPRYGPDTRGFYDWKKRML
jgi:hypothetical protein